MRTLGSVIKNGREEELQTSHGLRQCKVFFENLNNQRATFMLEQGGTDDYSCEQIPVTHSCYQGAQ